MSSRPSLHPDVPLPSLCPISQRLIGPILQQSDRGARLARLSVLGISNHPPLPSLFFCLLLVIGPRRSIELTLVLYRFEKRKPTGLSCGARQILLSIFSACVNLGVSSHLNHLVPSRSSLSSHLSRLFPSSCTSASEGTSLPESARGVAISWQ